MRKWVTKQVPSILGTHTHTICDTHISIGFIPKDMKLSKCLKAQNMAQTKWNIQTALKLRRVTLSVHRTRLWNHFEGLHFLPKKFDTSEWRQNSRKPSSFKCGRTTQWIKWIHSHFESPSTTGHKWGKSNKSSKLKQFRLTINQWQKKQFYQGHIKSEAKFCLLQQEMVKPFCVSRWNRHKNTTVRRWHTC